MSQRHAALLVGLAVPFAIWLGSTLDAPLLALALIAIGLAVGGRHIPGFWTNSLRAVLAGGLAGILVLGPGYRLAMRIVAITDSSTTPEFSIGGTAFIVVGLGAMFGGITTGWVTILTRAFALARTTAMLALTTVVGLTLFADSEVLSELTELGMGPWLNVPMFLGVTVAFAWLADRWARPDRTPARAYTDPVGVAS